MTHSTPKRVFASDVTPLTIFPISTADGTVLHSKEDYDVWLAARKKVKADDSQARRVQTHDIVADSTGGPDGEFFAGHDDTPGKGANAGEMTCAEYEAAARALEEANQPKEAIENWHRSAIAHAKAGNLAGVIAAIVHAEKAGGNRSFAPSLARKATSADAATGGGEVFRGQFDGDVPDKRTGAEPDESRDGEVL